jgi:hypothetical protein
MKSLQVSLKAKFFVAALVVLAGAFAPTLVGLCDTLPTPVPPMDQMTLVNTALSFSGMTGVAVALGVMLALAILGWVIKEIKKAAR